MCVGGSCRLAATKCATDVPCPGARPCIEGYCYAPEDVACTNENPNGYCPDGQYCESGQCTDATSGPCSSENPAGDCPGSEQCREGQCEPVSIGGGCSPSAPSGVCPLGSVCVDGSCVDLAPDSNACAADNPNGLCPSGETCVSGTCEPIADDAACSAETPDGLCDAGARCQNGTCVFPECSAANPQGACENPNAFCDNGSCALQPCSALHPAGKCPEGQICNAGDCVCPCSDACGPAQVCDSDPSSSTCGECVCDTTCGGGCSEPGTVCDTDTGSSSCGQCVCDTTCGGGCSEPGAVCDTDTRSSSCGQCVCDTTCGGGCSEPGTVCDTDTGSSSCGQCVCDTTCGGGCPANNRVCDSDTSSSSCGECLCVPEQLCSVSGACCPLGEVCVADRYCQPPCPGDNYCGATGELCCGVGETCGPNLTCIKDCPSGQDVCGANQDVCCGSGQACIYDQCLDLGASCTSFVDCDFGEYCEPTLGRCITTEIGGGQQCTFPPPPDIFNPQVEWHFLGVTQEGGQWKLCENANGGSGDYAYNSCYGNVIISPIVADLDQAVEPAVTYQSPWSSAETTFPEGKYPEVLIKAYRTSNFYDQVIAIVDGRTAELERVISNRDLGHMAAANLDSDSQLEIVTTDNQSLLARDPYYQAPAGGGAICPAEDANGACEVHWQTNIGSNLRLAAPTVTDLNADGQAEVVIGSFVLDSRDGSVLIGNDTACPSGGPTAGELFGGANNYWGPLNSVADVDLDGRPEIIAGDDAIEVTESEGTWSCRRDWSSSAIGEGYVAVANFVDNTQEPYASEPNTTAWPNDKDYPEVVVIDGGTVALLHGKTGALMKSPVDSSNMRFNLFTRRGGPPNVADFDGDNQAEVSFAGAGCMVVIDPDCAVADANTRQALAADPASGCSVAPSDIATCTDDVQNGLGDMLGILWMDRTQDQSSAATGTSVFDFQGDGKAEVLYNDECFFRVYDGTNGDVLVERPSSNRTGTEYPIVVDVDGDRSSEILIASNNDESGSRDACNGASDHAYRDAQDKNGNSMDLYDPSFCGCGHLNSTQRCNQTPGCTWNTSQGQCEVSGSPRPDDPEDICQDGTWGIWSLGDVNDTWVRTLPYWHQHPYHVTEVDRSGQPVADWGAGQNNWDIYNNYRQNVQGYVPLNAPNLEMFSLATNLLECPPFVALSARIVNSGSRGYDPQDQGPLPVSFYTRPRCSGGSADGESCLADSDCPGGSCQWELLDTVTINEAIAPGRGVNIGYDYTMQPQDLVMDFKAVVNDDGAASGSVNECRVDDNTAYALDVSCFVR